MQVIVADDAALIREGLSRLLVDQGFEVMAQAEDAVSLLELVDRHRPTVVVSDIRMPPTHTNEGLEAAREIRARYPEIGVLLLSQYLSTTFAFKLISEGLTGVGYLLKERVAHIEEIADALHRVARGETVLDPEVVSRLVQRNRVDDPIEGLSERELEVLQLMAEGRSNSAIAEKLFLSPKTLSTHIGSIFSKLNLPPDTEGHRRVQAVLTYLRSTAREG
ncbi:MAG: response regulator transcription factor [Actinomycetota bacterium]|nr:response regulator transcription factor [Actinomycetota bacterium]